MDGGSYRRWVIQTLSNLRSLTDSKITWRPHPKDRWWLEGVDGVSDPEEEPLAAALNRSWLVVTYNSTAGLEALISGLPVVAEGPAVYSGLAWKLNQFARVVPPDVEGVRDLLAAVAYTQWTAEEIASGLPLEVALKGRTLPGRPPEPEPQEEKPQMPLAPEVHADPPPPTEVPAAAETAPYEAGG
jgi:hypothetical protein